MFGIKEKEITTNKQDSLQREFLEEMSCKIRDPLNSICGITEIVMKSINNECNREQLLTYMDMLAESVRQLQQTVDDEFVKYDCTTTPESINEGDNADYAILNNLRILLADDNGISQKIIKELLEGYNAIVTECSTGKEVVDLFCSSITGSYDVVLINTKLKEMDGYEVTDKIRYSSHPQARMIPIIAMTSDMQSGNVKTALQAGMNAHLYKPFSINKIVNVLKSIK